MYYWTSVVFFVYRMFLACIAFTCVFVESDTIHVLL